MSIVIEDVRKILMDLGVHSEGKVNEPLAQSIMRTMFARGQTVATEEFVRQYLLDGGTVIPADAPVDPDHVVDEDDNGEAVSYTTSRDNVRARIAELRPEAEDADNEDAADSICSIFDKEGFHTFTDAMVKELL